MRKTLITARKKLDAIYASEEAYAEALLNEIMKQSYLGDYLKPKDCVGEFVLLFDIYPRNLAYCTPMSTAEFRKYFYSWLITKNEKFKGLDKQGWERGNPRELDLAMSTLVQNWGIYSIRVNDTTRLISINSNHKLSTITLAEEVL